MGMFDKLSKLIKLDDDENGDEYDSYDEEDDYDESPEPEKKQEDIKPFGNKATEKKNQQPVARRRVPMNDSSVCVFKPKAFDEAREIAQTLLEDKTVLMNFEGIDLAVSQRVLDVITGVCIAIGGNLQQISNYIFIATPASVDVFGDFQDTIAGVFDGL